MFFAAFMGGMVGGALPGIILLILVWFEERKMTDAKFFRRSARTEKREQGPS
jgi:hypothetical protein